MVVYNYQYMLDPKISALVSRSLERESIVVFDEAHNIDNVCIEALSVNLDSRVLNQARGNLRSLKTQVDQCAPAPRRAQPKRASRGRATSAAPPSGRGATSSSACETSTNACSACVLRERMPPHRSVRRPDHSIAAAAAGCVCVQGLAGDDGAAAGGGDRGEAAGGAQAGSAGNGGLGAVASELVASPVLPEDVVKEAMPGNLQRAQHFLSFMRRIIHYLAVRGGGAPLRGSAAA